MVQTVLLTAPKESVTATTPSLEPISTAIVTQVRASKSVLTPPAALTDFTKPTRINPMNIKALALSALTASTLAFAPVPEA